ncbi:MAG: 2-C-methyl-D-erythritol 4-phosphate cytidylyltransferase [Xylophilus ampelinus]
MPVSIPASAGGAVFKPADAPHLAPSGPADPRPAAPEAARAPVPPPARLWALVPCAGSGSRAGAGGAKQYRELLGRPMVAHTLDAFAGVARLDGVLVVVAAGDGYFDGRDGRDGPGAAALPAGDARFAVARCGGATRAASVAAGLAALRARGADAADWVLVHDAARCLVTAAQVDALIDACLGDAVGGLLAQPLADTLKRSGADGRVDATVDRAGKWQAQTPQMFRLGPLAGALAHAGDAVTDESSAIEALGLRPRLVPPGGPNFKVTWPEDFALAAAVLRARGATAAA